MNNPQRIRQAIIAALPVTTATGSETPERRFMYIPPAHLKALRLENQLVVGMRGAGKSFWTAALAAEPLRAIIGQAEPKLAHTTVSIGFAAKADISSFPNSDTLAQLRQNAAEPYDIWRAVVARWLATITGEHIPTTAWQATVDWVRQNPEPLARMAQAADQRLANQQRYGLLVFDALDRTGTGWETVNQMVSDLLRVALWLTEFQRLRAKVFLREDQLDKLGSTFPDAAKLIATKTVLSWERHDLHGLLWQRLCNADGEHGSLLRDIYTRVTGQPLRAEDDVWTLSDEVKRDEAIQRRLFAALAGDQMGKDSRRGVPYVWSVSHLADGKGRVSPRSFLAAMQAAAEDSLNRYPNDQLALHYESIKRGVQHAAQIRLHEITEDYPWIKRLMEPLRGLNVPCPFETIQERWREHFPGGPRDISGNYLPPKNTGPEWSGIWENLIDLGIFERTSDGRINMPDIYRIGFGLGRRGGVKPIKPVV
ncbi:MAG: hypothetical protein NZQ09_00795 [Chloroflexus sp.]|nr:hypothetical protein [Chloroflexus sp.]